MSFQPGPCPVCHSGAHWVSECPSLSPADRIYRICAKVIRKFVDPKLTQLVDLSTQLFQTTIDLAARVDRLEKALDLSSSDRKQDLCPTAEPAPAVSQSPSPTVPQQTAQPLPPVPEVISMDCDGNDAASSPPPSATPAPSAPSPSSQAPPRVRRSSRCSVWWAHYKTDTPIYPQEIAVCKPIVYGFVTDKVPTSDLFVGFASRNECRSFIDRNPGSQFTGYPYPHIFVFIKGMNSKKFAVRDLITLIKSSPDHVPRELLPD